MSELAVVGKSRSAGSTVTVDEEDHGSLVGTAVTANVKRNMHLNPPIVDEARQQRKRVSWWNVAAQETRAEGINAIEAHIGRPLSVDEWSQLQVYQNNIGVGLPLGIYTTVSVWLDS